MRSSNRRKNNKLMSKLATLQQEADIPSVFRLFLLLPTGPNLVAWPGFWSKVNLRSHISEGVEQRQPTNQLINQLFNMRPKIILVRFYTKQHIYAW